MFEFEQLEQLPMMQSVDPTPDDGDITDIDWLQIGLDRVLMPVLGGMAVAVTARQITAVTIPVSIIGAFALPGLTAMAFLSHPRNKFKWIFTLLSYTAGLAFGLWDLVQSIAVESLFMGSIVLAFATVLAVALCWIIKGIVRHA